MSVDCKARISCNTCVDNLGCVWYSIDNNCIPGDDYGPHDKSLILPFSHKVCSSKSCEDFKNCKTCTENKSCGWCKIIKSCVTNGSYKADKGICPKGYVNKSNRRYDFSNRVEVERSDKC